MNQKVRESLSAVMDGEGDELEMRRVLKSLEQNPEEADTWRRYHMIGSVMRRERDISASVDLSESIRARIEAQEPLNDSDGNDENAKTSENKGKRSSGPFSFMGNAAIAATVSLMVITGVQVYQGTGESTEELPQANASGSSYEPSGAATSFAGSPSFSGGNINTVSLSSESANEQGYGGRNSSEAFFPVYADEEMSQSQNDTNQQVKALRGFLDQQGQAEGERQAAPGF